MFEPGRDTGQAYDNLHYELKDLLLYIYMNIEFNEDWVFTPNGIFETDPTDIYIHSTMLNNHVFEHDLINHVIRPYIEKAKYVVDVGANIGCHAISYGRFNPDAAVWAFEPQNKLFEILNRNIIINKLKNTIAYNYGLGHKDFTCTLNSLDNVFDTSRNGHNKGGIGIGHGGESIKIHTLDSLDLPGLDFMKIDVEGAEGLVIRGAENTIKKFHPTILFEHNYQRVDPASVDLEYVPTPFEELSRLGYTTFKHIENDNYITEG
jgi:FkbM family methyltransferase